MQKRCCGAVWTSLFDPGLESIHTSIFDVRPSGRAQLANHLDEAVRQLRVELDARREADVELEALQILAV
jgi:hypothetical protein